MTFPFQNTLSRNTHSAYNSGTTSFAYTTRDSHNGSILPASEETMLLFASYLSDKVHPNTIKVYLAAVRNLHIQHGFSSPVEHSLLLPRLLRGIKRVYTTVQRPACQSHLHCFYTSKSTSTPSGGIIAPFGRQCSWPSSLFAFC